MQYLPVDQLLEDRKYYNFKKLSFGNNLKLREVAKIKIVERKLCIAFT